MKVQEDFQTGGGTLLEKLEQYIATCEVVIVIAGRGYGTEPQPGEAPKTSPARSYTQWEYFFAQGERLRPKSGEAKHTLVYFASEQFKAETPLEQPQALADRQSAFIHKVMTSGKDYGSFNNQDELCKKVLIDIPPNRRKVRLKPWETLTFFIVVGVIYVLITYGPNSRREKDYANKVLELIYQKAPPSTNIPPDTPAPELRCDIFAARENESNFYLLRDGDTLKSLTDKWMLALETFTPGYLYVFCVNASGRIHSEFVNGQTNWVTAHQTVTIPARPNAYIHADQKTGTERYYFVFCRERWKELEQRLQEVEGVEPYAPVPERLHLGNRGTRGSTPSTNPIIERVLMGNLAHAYLEGQTLRATNSHLVIERWFKHS